MSCSRSTAPFRRTTRASSVAGVHWPSGSTVRIISVLDYRLELALAPWLIPTQTESLELDRPRIEANQQLLDAAASSVRHEGVTVETAVLRGRPATAIVTEAATFQADLVVLGSRGHGTVTSMLLGSVSAEVVDQAPCPVLVARHGRLGSAMLAMDGSEGATHALALLRHWSIFRHVPIHVLGVADVPVPITVGAWAEADLQLMETYSLAVERDRALREDIVDDAIAELTDAHLTATGQAEEGDASATIVRVAAEKHADLVIVGSRGQTGLTRLLLGSVARNVLLHTRASVLVVRQAVRVADDPGVEADAYEPNGTPVAVG